MLPCPAFERHFSVSPGPVVNLDWPSTPDQGLQACSAVDLRLKAASVLGLCSGYTQYSAQRPQRTAGERNTTPLSHLADVPVLLYSLPHFFPLLSLFLPGSISNSCPIRMGQWGAFLYMCGSDERLFIVCKRQRRSNEREKEMKSMQEMEENKDKYTRKQSK